MFWKSEPQYLPLNDPSTQSPSSFPVRTWRAHSHHLQLLLLLLLSTSTSFLLGRLTAPFEDDERSPIYISSTSKTFHYNSSFGTLDPNISAPAWASLFPTHGGFFSHPQIAPERSAFAVFHQLHCLRSLQLSISAFSQMSVVPHSDEAPHARDAGHHEHGTDLEHVRHCVDLLRQALMCRPDLTIERKDAELGGVTGFGTEHRCRDWGELVAWAEEWGARGAPMSGGR